MEESTDGATVEEPPESREAFNALLDHVEKCTLCRLRDDGGYCQAAAALIRTSREARA